MLTCFASDMLIIRHGRSRVRHSTEKDHIRWGLKAFDNLTLDNDYDNDTMLNGNQSFFGNGTDILYPNTSAEKLYLFSTVDYQQQQQPTDFMAKQTANSNGRALTTTTASGAVKKKIGKKQIMASIQQAVDKGLEYLKAHAHLTDENVNIDLPKTEEIVATSDLVPLNDDGKTVNRNALSLTTSRFPQTPTAVSPKIGVGTTNGHIMVSASNNSDNSGKKQFRAGNTFDIIQNDINNHTNNSGKRLQQIPIVSTTTTASNINNDLNKQFIVGYNKAQQDKQKLDGNGVRSSNSDEHFNHLPLNKTENHIIQQNNHHHQQQQQHPHQRQKSDNSSNDNKNNKSTLIEDKIVAAHNNPLTDYDDNVEAIMFSGLHSTLSLKSANDGASVAAAMISSGNSNNDEQTALSVGQSPAVNDNGVYEEMSDKFVLNENANDDGNNNSGGDGENSDENKTNNSDEQSAYVSVLGEDDEGGGVGGNVRRPFVVDDYVDLEGLDETSRNNRLNLIKGQDVVTKFLQIVETQHLLGSNCTAGTALNLGEGVVDRYAQDRFRVEAEIAVNRANMLTR